MKYGYFKVAAAIPSVSVADCFYNTREIERLIHLAATHGVELITFPELSITSYTCMDLFQQQTLLDKAETALLQLIQDTQSLDIVSIVGLPLRTENALINAAVAFQKGRILGVVPKSYLPNYKEFQEKRWFTSSQSLTESTIRIGESA